jgi:Cu-Zn family superoxide dismutase
MNRAAFGAVSGALLLTACAALYRPEGPTATAVLLPASGSQARGAVTFTQAGEKVRITGAVTGMAPGAKGFHIHEKGDCSDFAAMSAGAHFSPHQTKHGGPDSPEHHAGDFGNVVADESGIAAINMTVHEITVDSKAPFGILGRALIVHVAPDDLKTDPTGNSGARAACGVIRG